MSAPWATGLKRNLPGDCVLLRTESRNNMSADGVDPGYLWNLWLGRIEPSRSVCTRCGEQLVHSSDWWMTGEMTDRYGAIRCAQGGYHIAAKTSA